MEIIVFLVKHWKQSLVALAAAVLIGWAMKLRHERDAAMVLKGKAEALAAVNGLIVAKQDSLIRTDSTTIEKLRQPQARDSAIITRLVVKHDTVQKWRSDTVYRDGVPSFEVPVSDVAASDTVKDACVEVLQNCSAIQAAQKREIANWQEKYDALKRSTSIMAPPEHHFGSYVKAGAAGAILGGVIGFFLNR